MKTLNEFFGVYDTLGLYLVNVGLEHGLKGGAQGLFGELEIVQNLFHLRNGYTASSLSVGLYQRVVQLQFLEEHFGDVHFVQEDFVVNLARFFLV